MSVFFSFLCFCSMMNNLFAFINIRRLKTYQAPAQVQLKPGKKLYLILKVYQETAQIRQTIARLSQDLAPFENVTVLIVGTIKERDSSGRNPTLELAQQAVRNNTLFHILECPIVGTHAHQNNYAIASIKTDPKNTWIMTLDIDTDVTQDGFKAFIEAINADRRIIQQTAFFLSNYAKVDFFQKGNAVYQSRWKIIQELKRVQLNKWTHGWFLLNAVGHGLCINLKEMQALNGFSEAVPIEDVALGYVISAMNKRMDALPVIELADVPTTWKAGFKQKITWAYGPMYFPIYYKRFRQEHPAAYQANKLRAFVIMLEGFYAYFAWCLISPVILGAIFCALSGSVSAVAFLAFYCLEYGQSVHLFIHKYRLKTSFWKALAAGLCESLLISWPALAALGILCIKKAPVKFKTEHV